MFGCGADEISSAAPEIIVAANKHEHDANQRGTKYIG